MPRLLKVHFASVSQYEVRKMFGNIGPLISAHEQLLACLTVDNTAESPWAERFLNLVCAIVECFVPADVTVAQITSSWVTSVLS